MLLTLVILDEPDVARVLLDGDWPLPGLGLPAGELRRHLGNMNDLKYYYFSMVFIGDEGDFLILVFTGI